MAGEVEEVGRSGMMFSNGLLWQIRSAQITDHGSAMLKYCTVLLGVTLVVCCDATLTYLGAARCVQLKLNKVLASLGYSNLNVGLFNGGAEISGMPQVLGHYCLH